MSFVIVSADIAGEAPHANLGNSIELRNWLNSNYGVGNVTPVHGQYRGRGEMSFLVDGVSRFEAWDIWQYANEEFDQESVLFVDDDDNAYLYFYRRCPDAGGRDDEYVGAWTEMASQAAPPSGDWTLIGNSYFITRDKGRW